MKINILCIYALAIAMALTGCKGKVPSESGADPVSAAYVPEEDGVPDSAPYIITESGVFVYWESEQNLEKMRNTYELYDREKVEQWWLEVQDCLGMKAEPTFVRMVDNIFELCPGLPNTATGGYCSVYGVRQIVLPVDKAYNDHTPVWDAGDDRRVWKHEFIHHIAEENGIEEHSNHGGPEGMWDCQFH